MAWLDAAKAAALPDNAAAIPFYAVGIDDAGGGVPAAAFSEALPGRIGSSALENRVDETPSNRTRPNHAMDPEEQPEEAQSHQPLDSVGVLHPVLSYLEPKSLVTAAMTCR